QSARHRREHPSGGELANSRAIGIGEKQIARAIQSQRSWSAQLGVECRPVIAESALRSSAGNGGDDSLWRDAADAMVVGIRNEDIPRPVGRDRGRIPELRAGGRAAIAG